MQTGIDLAQAAQLTTQRLLPRLDAIKLSKANRKVFVSRFEQEFPRAFEHLYHLYGDQYDFFYHLQCIVDMVARTYAARPADLKQLDKQRAANPDWFLSEIMMGGVAYVDLFAGDLQGVRAKIPYFKELGLTYLHLMPLFAVPEGNSDGGYAVSDYRTVDPKLGTMEELAALAKELRANGISLVLDFVFNHTSDEHTWAQRALAGDPDYQAYYRLFPDRTLPDQYEKHLREIFPEQAPGSFTYNETLEKWVWTTFNRFQWDLNYANPAVFTAMLAELLFLANQGVEALRLDAVAFVWKQLGTDCENLPQAHWIIRAFNAFVRIVAPAMAFKSEAIVHPDFVDDYIAPEECQISYNPTLMALLWEALATREVKLLRHSMSKRFDLPEHTAWINYVRVHDDIGWSFADEDAAPEVDNTRTDLDVLPGAALRLELVDDMYLRAGYGMTVARPQTRELAPYQYYDFIRDRNVQGDPDLQRTLIQNADLRWEWFFGEGEILALSAFYKYFDQPIELQIQNPGNYDSLYINADYAHNVGGEIEFRFNFRHFHQDLSWLSLSTNFALIWSTVELPPELSGAVASERPLVGQAPYVANVSLLVDEPETGLTASLVYNVVGPRITEKRIQPAPEASFRFRHNSPRLGRDRRRSPRKKFHLEALSNSSMSALNYLKSLGEMKASSPLKRHCWGRWPLPRFIQGRSLPRIVLPIQVKVQL